MNLDDIKAHLDRIFAARGGSARDDAAMLHEALVEFKIGINALREALAASEADLERARREVTDYERRGSLAEGIGDTETAAIAAEYTERARGRADLLERKVIVQRDELMMAERDYAATKARFQAARRGIPSAGAPPGDPLSTDSMSPFEQAALEQRAREAAVDAQLAHLKKKLGERP